MTHLWHFLDTRVPLWALLLFYVVLVILAVGLGRVLERSAREQSRPADHGLGL